MSKRNVDGSLFRMCGQQSRLCGQQSRLCGLLKEKRWLLPAVLYALAWLTALAAAVGLLLTDAVHRKTGVLAAEELHFSDFVLYNAHTEGDTCLVADTEDPQLHYAVPAGKRLQSLTLTPVYDRYPGERCLYYVTGPEQAFGQDRRVWPQENADGSVTFALPRGVTAVRLDPGSAAGLVLEADAVTANLPQKAWRYFVPEAGTAFALLALPGLAAAVLQWGVDFASLHGSRKRK